MSEKQNVVEPSFKLNYVTGILLLVIVIPVLYTVYANLQKPTPLPEITPAQAVATPVASPADAINEALKAVAAKPDYASYINLGLAYYKSSMYRESISAWEKALEYNPQGELAFNNIAAAYGNLNDYDAEIKICERALAINPNLDIAKRNMEWAKSMKNKK